MENQKSLINASKLWLMWIFASSVGLVILYVLIRGGIAFLIGISDFTHSFNLTVLLIFAIVTGLTSVLVGIGLGYLQTIVIRPYLQKSNDWIKATIVGCMICGVISILASSIIRETISYRINYDFLNNFLFDLIFLMSYFLVGLSQWIVLKREIPSSFYWLITSLLGSVCSIFVIYILWNYALDFFFILISGVITLFMISGIGLVYLFSKNEFRKMNTILLSGISFILFSTVLLIAEASSKPIITIRGEIPRVDSMVFSSDGILATSPGNGGDFFILWDINTGEKIWQYQVDGGLTNDGIDISPNGDFLAVGSKLSNVLVFDLETKQVEKKLELRAPDPFGIKVRFLDEGNQLVAGSYAGHKTVWDVKNWKSNIIEARGYFDISPDGKLLASVDINEDWISLIDIKTGKMLKQLRTNSEYLDTVEFSSSGNLIAARTFGSTITIWDSETGDVKKVLSVDSHIDDFDFSNGGKMIAATQSGDIWIWDLETGEEYTIPVGAYQSARSVAFSPDDKMLAIGFAEGDIQVWDLSEIR